MFVICGPSGSGKTWSIELANQSLPVTEAIAECGDILHCRDVEQARSILNGSESKYVGCKYVAYACVYREVGIALRDMAEHPVIFVG